MASEDKSPENEASNEIGKAPTLNVRGKRERNADFDPFSSLPRGSVHVGGGCAPSAQRKSTTKSKQTFLTGSDLDSSDSDEAPLTLSLQEKNSQGIKKRGRPPGARNKTKQPIVAGADLDSSDSDEAPLTLSSQEKKSQGIKKRGRPPGARNKTKAPPKKKIKASTWNTSYSKLGLASLGAGAEGAEHGMDLDSGSDVNVNDQRSNNSGSDDESESESDREGNEGSDSDTSEVERAAIEQAVSAAPAGWVDRYKHIAWATMPGYPNWPAYIYDPRNSVISSNAEVHKPDKVGKSYIVYYFGYENGKIEGQNGNIYGWCQHKKLVDWDKGLELKYDTPSKISKACVNPFAAAVIQAKAEMVKPLEERLAWRSHEKKVKAKKAHVSRPKPVRRKEVASATSAKRAKEKKPAQEEEEDVDVVSVSSNSSGGSTEDSSSDDSDSADAASSPEIGSQRSKLSMPLPQARSEASKTTAMTLSGQDSDGAFSPASGKRRGRPKGSTNKEKKEKPKIKKELSNKPKPKMAQIESSESSHLSAGLAGLAASAVKPSTMAATPKLTRDEEIRSFVKKLEAAGGLQRDTKPDGKVFFKPNPTGFNEVTANSILDYFRAKEISRDELEKSGIIKIVRYLRSVEYFNDSIKQKADSLFNKWKLQFQTPGAQAASSGGAASAGNSATSGVTAPGSSLVRISSSGSLMSSKVHGVQDLSGDTSSVGNSIQLPPGLLAVGAVRESNPVPLGVLPNEPWNPALCPDILKHSNIRMNSCRLLHDALKSMDSCIHLEEACWQAHALGKDECFEKGFSSHDNRLNVASGVKDNFNGVLNDYIFCCNALWYALKEDSNRNHGKLVDRIVLKNCKNTLDLALVVKNAHGDLLALCK